RKKIAVSVRPNADDSDFQSLLEFSLIGHGNVVPLKRVYGLTAHAPFTRKAPPQIEYTRLFEQEAAKARLFGRAFACVYSVNGILEDLFRFFLAEIFEDHFLQHRAPFVGSARAAAQLRLLVAQDRKS